MSLGFLTPLFLTALAAVALPILVHLSRRRQTRVLDFPSLMFLSRVPYRSMRRRRIRNWALMALRIAAYALIALAFARPLLQGWSGDSSAGESRRHRVIVLDRSYSLGYDDRWPLALAEARRAGEGLAEGDLVSLVTFQDSAETLLAAASDPSLLEAALSGLEPGDGITRFAPATKLARQLLLESATPQRDVVLISDFQRTGRPKGEELHLPSGTEVELVDVGLLASGDPAEIRNVAITDLGLDRGRSAGRDRLAVSARLVNTGGTPAPAVEVELELNGRLIEVQTVAVEAGGRVSVPFEPAVLEAGITTRGIVRARTGDLLEHDDLYQFAVNPSQGVPVLIIDSGRGQPSLFVERALGLGQDPYFRTRRVRVSGLSASDLAEQPVVLLNDVLTDLDAGAAELLAGHVERGGGLWVVMGSAYRTDRRPPVADRLAVPAVTRTERSSASGNAVAVLDFEHPALEVFAAPRSGDFSSAHIFRFHDLELDERHRVLARFADGRAALVEARVGDGRVLVWPSTLDTFWSDLALQPVFLPFVHQLVQYLAGYRPGREWYEVGQVADLSVEAQSRYSDEAAPGVASGEWLVISPSGAQSTVPARESLLLELPERGFWELRPVGPEGAREEPLVVAVNLDTSESDLTPLDVELLESSLQPLVQEEIVREGAAGSDTAEREGRQRLWWLLLALVAVILGLEAFLAWRLSSGGPIPLADRWGRGRAAGTGGPSGRGSPIRSS